MIETKCGWCGKPLAFRTRTEVRKFCSRNCSRSHKQKLYETEDEVQVVLPPLEEISDEGFLALVEAIVGQAKTDVLTSAPGTVNREDAEEFFLSEYFYELTNLDGFDILCRLQDKYDEKMKKKAAKKAYAECV